MKTCAAFRFALCKPGTVWGLFYVKLHVTCAGLLPVKRTLVFESVSGPVNSWTASWCNWPGTCWAGLTCSALGRCIAGQQVGATGLGLVGHG